MKLNLCSGSRLLPGFLNVDIEPQSGGDFLNADVTSGLHWQGNNSVEFINISQGAEHFNLPQLRALLKECHRVLIPKGVVRIASPDFRKIVFEYLNHRMNRYASVQPEIYQSVKSQSLKASLLLLGNMSADCTRNHYTGHQLVLDYEGISELLYEAGFTMIALCQFDQTYDAPVGENHSFVVEATK